MGATILRKVLTTVVPWLSKFVSLNRLQRLEIPLTFIGLANVSYNSFPL